MRKEDGNIGRIGIQDVAGHDDQVGVERIHPLDGGIEFAGGQVRADVQVADVGDLEPRTRTRPARKRHLHPRDLQPMLACHVAIHEKEHEADDTESGQRLHPGRQGRLERQQYVEHGQSAGDRPQQQ